METTAKKSLKPGPKSPSDQYHTPQNNAKTAVWKMLCGTICNKSIQRNATWPFCNTKPMWDTPTGREREEEGTHTQGRKDTQRDLEDTQIVRKKMQRETQRETHTYFQRERDTDFREREREKRECNKWIIVDTVLWLA